MAEPSRPLIIRGGVATFLALCALAISQAPLGSPWFFILSGVPCVVYALLWRQLGTAVPEGVSVSRLLKIALLLAVVFHYMVTRKTTQSEPSRIRGAVVGLLSPVLWFSVGIAGRAIGFY